MKCVLQDSGYSCMTVRQSNHAHAFYAYFARESASASVTVCGGYEGMPGSGRYTHVN